MIIIMDFCRSCGAKSKNKRKRKDRDILGFCLRSCERPPTHDGVKN